MVEKQSQLPTENNRQYLHIKVEYAMRFPRLSAKIRRNNKSYQMSLKQLMMSGSSAQMKSRQNITGGTKRKYRLISAPRRPALISAVRRQGRADGIPPTLPRTGKRHLSPPGRDYSEEQEGPLAGTCGARYRGSDACG
jgi:hypothetical protein